MSGEQTAVKKAVDDYMSAPTDIGDGYWSLFDVKGAVSDAIVEAVKYGFEQGYKAAKDEK